MQWLLAALIWFGMVGGLAGYLAIRGQPQAGPERELTVADVSVSLGLESTADLGGETDPFAMTAEQAVDAVTLRLRDGTGAERVVSVPMLAAGTARTVELAGFVVGRNEVLVEVAPVQVAAALRMTLTIDGRERSSETLWLEPGVAAVATIPVPLGVTAAGHVHD